MLSLLVCLLAALCVCRASHIEDVLETEIDPREPRSFIRPDDDELLAARPRTAFDWIIQNIGDGQVGHRIPNWELFSLRYWYETRTPNCSCPMLPQTIGKFADWTLMIPCMFGNVQKSPRIIYVHHYMLSHFIESTLQFMEPHHRFVLLSGGTDLTIPRSVDLRYHLLRGFAQDMSGGTYFQRLVNDPRLIHWFCENHDLTHPKVSTLPTGMSVPDPGSLRRDYPSEAAVPALLLRQSRVFVADRVRSATGTWALRAEVMHMCAGNPTCLQPFNGTGDMSDGTSHAMFVQLAQQAQFVACTRGGGLDPSPKAWEALILGAIPIIQHNSLDDGYDHFPVVFVSDWKDLLLHPNASAILAAHAQRLAPYFEKGSELRQKVLHKLKTEFWIGKVRDKLKAYDAAHPEELAALTNPPPSTKKRHLLQQQHEEGEKQGMDMDMGSIHITMPVQQYSQPQPQG